MRVLKLINAGIEWLQQVNELWQLEEVRATANHLAQSLIWTKATLTGFEAPSDLKNRFRATISHIDRSMNQLRRAEQARLARAQSVPPNSVPNADSKLFSKAIIALVNECTPEHSEITHKEKLKLWLQSRINARFPESTLQTYGSSGSGLGVRGADLDLCLLLGPGKVQDACRGLVDSDMSDIFDSVQDVIPSAQSNETPVTTELSTVATTMQAPSTPVADHENESFMSLASAAALRADNPSASVGVSATTQSQHAQTTDGHANVQSEDFEDEIRERRKVAAGKVIQVLGEIFRPLCRRFDVSTCTNTTDQTTHEDMPSLEKIKDTTDASSERSGNMEQLREIRQGKCLDLLLIIDARVPILTIKVAGQPYLEDDSSLVASSNAEPLAVTEIDVSIEHWLVVRNTALLKTYAAVDERAKLLMMMVKIWSKRVGIADATNGTLSSYGWFLLVVFFLQQIQPPVLPNLQAQDLLVQRDMGRVVRDWRHPPKPESENWDTSFCEDAEFARATMIATHGKNTSSIGELLLDFFDFYAWIFPYKTQVISPRKGKSFPKSEYEPGRRHTRRLYFVDLSYLANESSC